ncbi:YadA-like family protein [Caballeronia sordidicola]|nr:YadA-like family protein [Caballeronia sordidicola]
MARAQAANSSALGATSTASATRSVALGYGSVANVANTVSVGTTSATRKIVNVTAGDISSSTSTDVVNGSQLYATNQNVDANTTAIAANTSDLATNTSNISTLSTQIADAVKYDSTAHDTITLGGTGGTKITNVAAGDISSATSTDAVNGAQLYATNQNVAANTTAIATNASDIAQNTTDISTINTQVGTLNTQIAGAVKYDGTAHDTITLGGTAGTKITNVAAGDISSATSTDAVNGSQLYATNQNVAANATAIAANTSDIATNAAAIATNTTDIAQNTSDIGTINTQVGTLNTQVANAVKYDDATHDTITLAGTAGTKITNVAAGDISSATSTDAVNGSQLYATNQNVAANTTAIATNTRDIATNTTAIATNASNIATNTADIAQNTSDISTINTQVGTLSTQIADAVKYDGTAHDTITLAGTAGTKIANVAAGDISSATSTDAVNGSQLYATNQNVAANATAIAANTTAIATNTSNISTLNTQMADAVKYDDTEHGSMTLGGSAGTVIKNVAAAQMTADSTEAVNGSQLFAVQQSVSDQSAAIADSVRYDSSSHDKITLGASGTPVVLTNVKAGDVSASSLDAVNGSQLYAVTQDVAQNTTDIAGLTASMNDLSGGTTGLVRQDATTLALSVGATTGGSTVSFAGLDGARVLSGVANGAVNSASSEAINGSQLFHASARTAAALGGGASVDANGGVTAPSYTVGGKQVSDVGSAVSNLDDRVTQNSADIASVKGGLADVSKTAANAVAYDSADHNKVTLGGTDASAAVQMTNVAAGDLSATSTDAVNGSQLGATNARVAATESAIANFEAAGVTGLAGTGDGSAAMGTNSNASGTNSTAAGANSNASGDDSTATGAYATASGNNATAAGAHSRASGDGSAAFGGNAAASGINAIAIGGNSQASGNGSAALGGNSSATADNSVALGANSVADEANTVSVGSAGNERRVTNVAPGVNGTDATNVNQLNALRNDVNSSMTSLQRAAFGGVAAAMAMPNLMPSSPGKTVVGAGVANYKGYNAIAAGATYRTENNRWLVNGAVSVTQGGDTGVRAQVGYEF